MQVEKLSLAAARRLRKHGVGTEVVVAVCVDEGWMMVLLQLAVLLAGGAFVPVDLSLPTKYAPRGVLPSPSLYSGLLSVCQGWPGFGKV